METLKVCLIEEPFAIVLAVETARLKIVDHLFVAATETCGFRRVGRP